MNYEDIGEAGNTGINKKLLTEQKRNKGSETTYSEKLEQKLCSKTCHLRLLIEANQNNQRRKPTANVDQPSSPTTTTTSDLPYTTDHLVENHRFQPLSICATREWKSLSLTGPLQFTLQTVDHVSSEEESSK